MSSSSSKRPVSRPSRSWRNRTGVASKGCTAESRGSRGTDQRENSDPSTRVIASIAPQKPRGSGFRKGCAGAPVAGTFEAEEVIGRDVHPRAPRLVWGRSIRECSRERKVVHQDALERALALRLGKTSWGASQKVRVGRRGGWHASSRGLGGFWRRTMLVMKLRQFDRVQRRVAGGPLGAGGGR